MILSLLLNLSELHFFLLFSLEKSPVSQALGVRVEVRSNRADGPEPVGVQQMLVSAAAGGGSKSSAHNNCE